MILYHFTSSYHLTHIVMDGYLEMWCSDLMVDATPDIVYVYDEIGEELPWTNPRKPYPLVVHPEHQIAVPLTRDGNYHNQYWKEGTLLDKAHVRFTVNVPEDELRHWDTWSRELDCNAAYLNAYNTDGYEDWYLVERRIPRREWVKVERYIEEAWTPVNVKALRRWVKAQRFLPGELRAVPAGRLR